MASMKIISRKLAYWRRYRQAVRELSALSDQELVDIGVHRCDIPSLARETATV